VIFLKSCAVDGGTKPLDVRLEIVRQVSLHPLTLRTILSLFLAACGASTHARVTREVAAALTADGIWYLFHSTKYNNN
jgi:hypothetical protein